MSVPPKSITIEPITGRYMQLDIHGRPREKAPEPQVGCSPEMRVYGAL